MKQLLIRGSAFDIGLRLGEFGRDAWHQKLTRTALWQTVTALQHSAQAAAMRERVLAHYPLFFRELEGLAAGLRAPFSEVFAWNCRGDLVRSTSDGCTTVAGRHDSGELVIAHNEDGFPQLRGDCALITVMPEEGLSFTSFAYPGSICGHTVAVNEKGIVNTVNNIRAVHRPDGMPRQVLARAALNAASLDEAVAVLTAAPRAGAFHHTLGQSGDCRLFSVEATGSGCSVLPIVGTLGHANHLIHPALAAVEQVITDSSASRQQRLVAWQQDRHQLDKTEAKAILFDRHNAELPIYRQSPQDPDEENTLATAIFSITRSGAQLSLYEGDKMTGPVSVKCDLL